MPFCRFKGDFGIDEDEEQMISGQLRQLHLIIVWFGFVTLEERLCSEKSNAQPQDGNFVQFWDNVWFEREDGGQVVQFSVETLPSRARYGYDQNGFGFGGNKVSRSFWNCNQSITSQLYVYKFTNRC